MAIGFPTKHTCSSTCFDLETNATVDDVCTFLEHIGQSKYCQWFKENNVNGNSDQFPIDTLNYLRNHLKIVDYFDAVFISSRAFFAKRKAREQKMREITAKRVQERCQENVTLLKQLIEKKLSLSEWRAQFNRNHRNINRHRRSCRTRIANRHRGQMLEEKNDNDIDDIFSTSVSSNHYSNQSDTYVKLSMF